jgi:cytochrome c553
MKRRFFTIAVFLTALAVAGSLLVVSGLIPITASSGHWPITAWFLHFSLRRSVATYTLGLETPRLDEPKLVLKGAGHYETGCRPCHGSPATPPPRVLQHMLPPPPYLPPRIAAWQSAERFYIVKHGVKFTGMPAWPSQQRDDEVWAMVAFLRTFPDLDAEGYQRLVNFNGNSNGKTLPSHERSQPQTVSRMAAQRCGRCHGVDGRGRGVGAFPQLAAQRPAYFTAALHAYARGERHSGIMEPIAAGLSLEDMRELASYYASLEKRPPPAPSRQDQDTMLVQRQRIARGKAIASHGIPSQRVPSCRDCHGPSVIRRNPNYPVLAGQYADYLVLQLELFKKKQRGGSAYAHLMRPIAAQLTPGQMRDVALYYASLTAGHERSAR